MYCPTISSIPHFYFILNYWFVFFRLFWSFQPFCVYFKLLTCIVRVFSSFRALLQFLFHPSGLYSPSILIVSILLFCNGGFVFSLYEIQQELRNCAVTIISRCDEMCVWEWTRIVLLRNSGNFIIFIIPINLVHFIEYRRVLPFINHPANKEKSKLGVLCCVVIFFVSNFETVEYYSRNFVIFFCN